MCQTAHNIYLCGHDETLPYRPCQTYHRLNRFRKGRNRRIPNHDTTVVERRPDRVCDICRRNGLGPKPEYVRAALNPPREDRPPRIPSPAPYKQRPPIPRPLPQAQPQPPPRPVPMSPFGQDGWAQSLFPRLPPGMAFPWYPGMDAPGRDKGPFGPLYSMEPYGRGQYLFMPPWYGY